MVLPPEVKTLFQLLIKVALDAPPGLTVNWLSVIFKKPEVSVMVWATWNLEPGAVVPMPTLPSFWIKSLEVVVLSPPTEVLKFIDPPFNAVKVIAGFDPVGAAMARFPPIEAVGVPLFMLRTANLAEAVEVPPMRRSTVELPG